MGTLTIIITNADNFESIAYPINLASNNDYVYHGSEITNYLSKYYYSTNYNLYNMMYFEAYNNFIHHDIYIVILVI